MKKIILLVISIVLLGGLSAQTTDSITQKIDSTAATQIYSYQFFCSAIKNCFGQNNGTEKCLSGCYGVGVLVSLTWDEGKIKLTRRYRDNPVTYIRIIGADGSYAAQSSYGQGTWVESPENARVIASGDIFEALKTYHCLK